jgi:hypothetical protein
MPLPYARSLGFPDSSSKRPHLPPGRDPEAINQRFGTVESCEPPLHVAQPSEVLVARLVTQGSLGVLELFI